MQPAFVKENIFTKFKNTRRIILSIDGGGVRGTISARFLSNLEHELKHRNINIPLHKLFDMFIGSSTGALIVCGISHCELSATYISDNFYNNEVTSKIMNKSFADKILGLMQTRPKFDGKGKRKMIKDIAGNKDFSDTENFTMIPVYNVTTKKPDLFKSWKHKNVSLVNVLDAASAAPGYFPSVEFKPNNWGIDSGLIAQNPALCAYIEMLKLFDPSDDIRILSIGTGYGYNKEIKKESEKWGGINWALCGDLLDLLLDAPMESEEYQIKTLTKINGHHYLRVDGHVTDTQMDDTSPENIKKLKDVGDQLWEKHKDQVIKLLFS